MINIYNEEKLSTKDRKELPASIYGLPSEKKYPLNDANHVRSAMAYFNHCDKNKKKELARNIMKAAKKFNVEISEDSEVYKTLNESYYDDFSDNMNVILEADKKKDEEPTEVVDTADDDDTDDYTQYENEPEEDDEPEEVDSDASVSDDDTDT